ncbi:MAG: sensor of ECF-type sigma factor [Flavobacterium sp.]|nr:sensor of ECF-type sigma factor [Flavobacterium sp.]
MKKYILIILFLISAFSYSQNTRNLERIKVLRIAYISNKLELSSEEAERFWPVFNAFDARQFNLRLKKKQLMFKLKPENSETFSESEMKNLLYETEDLDSEIQLNRKTFVKDLQGIISTKKILILKKLEEDFKNEMLKQIKNRRQNRD